MTFNSVYEITNNLSTIAGQHMIDYFSGNSLDDRWTETNVAGTGTFAMSDSVDGGFSITTATADNNNSSINFNNKRPFNYENSGCVGVVQKVATSSKIWCGFRNSGLVDSENWSSLYGDGQDGTYKSLTTGDGAGTSTANSSVANDTAWTLFKIETTPSINNLTINGVLEVSKTTDLNDAQKMQPIFQVKALTTGGKEGKIRYMEAWNH